LVDLAFLQIAYQKWAKSGDFAAEGGGKPHVHEVEHGLDGREEPDDAGDGVRSWEKAEAEVENKAVIGTEKSISYYFFRIFFYCFILSWHQA
jgi:hypothetical protein